MKTKEQIKNYNKEYFARPEVIKRAKIRNSRPEIKLRRKLYKKTVKGRISENSYRRKKYKEIGQQRRYERYGITPEKYKEMFSNQNGKCAICNKELDNCHIDHCHKTNIVRGLLCIRCNMALGLLKDDINFLKNAIKYLLK